MTRLPKSLTALLLVSAASALATPALAQDNSDKGPYVAARAGIAWDTDLKQKKRGPATGVQHETDFGSGFTGEVGGGYDFGTFRLESTIGYNTGKLDRKKAQTGGFLAAGRTQSLDLNISGYVDIPVSDKVVPYVGAGIGASHVDTRLVRVGGTPGKTARFDSKDWGFLWHVDAGIGFRATPTTTIELGTRYTQVTGLKYKSEDASTPNETFKPRRSSVQTTIGLRQAF